MRKLMTKRIPMISLLAVFASYFLLFPISASAIPALGVAPGAPGCGGTYFGPYPSNDLYQLVFADTFVGGGGGFAMPTTGGQLSIWYGANNGIVDEDKHVYLLTTSLSGNSFTFSVNGAHLQFQSQLELDVADVASYKPPIHGVNLGHVPGWMPLIEGEFGSGGKKFWVLTGTIEYSGFELGDWMYAATTNSPVVDQFSPQTTSSTVVPEPTTMLLLSSGLIGLAGFRRRFRKR